jgi:hypothetical protein
MVWSDLRLLANQEQDNDGISSYQQQTVQLAWWCGFPNDENIKPT